MGRKANVPAFVDMEVMAERGKTLDGSYVCSRLPRLAALLYGPLTEIDDVLFELRFFTDASGRPVIRGWIRATLPLLCQRCLRPMSLSLERPVSLCLVRRREEIQRLPPDMEPLEPSGASGLRLRDLVEDELLLSLPYAPRHEDDLCSLPGAPDKSLRG